MLNNNLQHHGIKGQKWGVRRFQKKDGSLTRAGKKRYSEATWEGPLPTLGEVAKMKTEDPERYAKYQAYKEAKGWDKRVKEQNETIQKMVKNANKDAKTNKIKESMNVDNLSKNVQTAKNLYDQYGDAARTMAKNQATKDARNRITYDLSQMSDNELKQVVNRLNMEERYTQVMMSRHAESGKSFVEKVLDGAGTALVIASSALALAEQIKKLKK